MQMKQPTHSQKWYDRLCLIYSIGDFPPLHSFSFTDWHWINDDDLEKNPPCKMIPSTSLSNDFWTMVMDEDEPPSLILYSDVVQQSSSSSPANVIVHRPSDKWRNSTLVTYEKKHNDNFCAETMMENDNDDDLWFQYKNTQRQTRHYQRRMTRRSLKQRISSQSCLIEHPHDDKNQRKRHTRKVTHQRKSPIRLVRHPNRHCTQRHR